VRRRDDQPRPLAEALDTVAGRLRRVDLRLIDEVRDLWPTVVDPVLAEHCRPAFIKSGVLLVEVPSGAFAQRVQRDAEAILGGLAPLGASAPTSLRTVLTSPKK
jgi:predicted nucleic acid-binding Zn ribbon protein